MKITNMSEEHISQIAILEKECFSSPWSENGLREELTQENARFVVATENEQVLGYAGMHLLFGEGYITNIAVFKNARKQGIGRKLTQSLIDMCEFSISLEVRTSNEVAIGLYESLGFKEVGKRKNFYQNPTEDAIIYTFIIKN